MTDLIKMTEEKIKMYKDHGKHPDNKKYFYISEITNLEEILSELKKRNCEGCKYLNINNKLCFKINQCIKNFEDTKTFYCSNWEAK